MKSPAAWLCCLLLTSPAWAADAVVSGKVYLERDGRPGRGATDPGLAGVQVSNGERIVKTAADGSYSLPVREGQTVFVIKPDAYAFPKASDGLPSFWRHFQPNGS
ncbi:TPA: metallophosphoesterase N-terminal domain-containing protein, partial [Stenotrophomonas maltophilia]|nr:calcineurin phosphoesterase [Stenotrophomonas maltophilia]